MNQAEEKQYWRKLIEELQKVMTIRELSDLLDISERQISNWKNGDRPKGMMAIRVYALHVKQCTRVHEPEDITKGIEGA